MTTTERIAAIREALEEAQKRIDDMRWSIDTGIHESELDDTHGDVGDALSHLATLEAEMSSEPVESEEQDLADRYLYVGWLASRPDRPWTDEDAREAFLHALKYARYHPPKPEQDITPTDLAGVVEAGDALTERIGCGCGGDNSECGTCNKAWQQWTNATKHLRQ